MVRVILIGAFVACLGMALLHGEAPQPIETASTVSSVHDEEPMQGTCGDGQCQPPEDCHSCPRDCGDCCGDYRCEPPEDCRSCPQDCGPCS